MKRFLGLLPFVVLLAGCNAGYFWQAAAGQAEVLRARRPFEQVLADPATPEELRRQLLVADEALVFARTELGLPRTGSYRHYADLGRPYVVWNVVAVPEFGLEPKPWCFPVAGCLDYKGFFSETRARQEAARLEAAGHDVFVGGVAAYATLGWFDDPLLNTMLNRSEEWLAGLIFHELAHLLVYVPGDSTFNESFASFVEIEGKRRWLAARGDQEGLARLARQSERRLQAQALLDELRAELARIYASPAPPEALRARKAEALARTRERYASLRAGWAEPPWFDAWFGPQLNNASLAALDTYEDYVPAFMALLEASGGDLQETYARVRALAARPAQERMAALTGPRGVLTARPGAESGPAGLAVPPLTAPAAGSMSATGE